MVADNVDHHRTLIIIGIVIIVVFLIGFIYLLVISDKDGSVHKKEIERQRKMAEKEWKSFDSQRQKEREAYFKSQKDRETSNNVNRSIDQDFDWERFR